MIMWGLQIFLALVFGAAGTMKLVRSKPQLAANPHSLAALAIVVATFR